MDDTPASPRMAFYGVVLNSDFGLSIYTSSFELSAVGVLVCLAACGFSIALVTVRGLCRANPGTPHPSIDALPSHAARFIGI